MTEQDDRSMDHQSKWRLIFHWETVLAAVSFAGVVAVTGTFIANGMMRWWDWSFWVAALLAYPVATVILALLSLIGGGSTHIELAVAYILFLVLFLIAMPAYRDYTIRQSIAEVVTAGRAATAALDRYHASEKSVPKSVDRLGVSMPRDKVMDVRIEDPNLVTATLSLPPVAGSQLVFVAFTTDGKRSWKCMARNIQPSYRPPGCREEFKASN